MTPVENGTVHNPNQLVFAVEWIDPDTNYHRKFHLIYYQSDKSVELIDLIKKKIFLRRTVCPKDIFVPNLIVGNQVRIFGRAMTILHYGNDATRLFIEKSNEASFVIIDFDQSYIGEIIQTISDFDFRFSKMKVFNFNQAVVDEVVSIIGSGMEINCLQNGPKILMELKAENIVTKLQSCFGPDDTDDAKVTYPHSLRAQHYGHIKFVIFDEQNQVRDLSKLLFTKYRLDSKDINDNDVSTCCVIKPHIVEEKRLGTILTKIAEHFTIDYLKIFYLNETDAGEFCEVYKGVVSDFQAFLYSFLNGRCVVLKISGLETDGRDDIVNAFRQFCGPFDSHLARQVRPNSLRGVFGRDLYQNAVHCSDLDDNVVVELQYFFRDFYHLSTDRNCSGGVSSRLNHTF